MEEVDITKLISEMREEYHLSPFREDSEFSNFVKDGVYDINNCVGCEIDYSKDLKARRLLKLYVLFADDKLTAEFKAKYISEYDELQRLYYVNNSSSI